MKTDTNKNHVHTVAELERTNSISLTVRSENNPTNLEKRLTPIEAASKLNMKHMAVVMDSKDTGRPSKKTS